MNGNNEGSEYVSLSRRRLLKVVGASALATGLVPATATAVSVVSATQFGITVTIDCTAEEVSIDTNPVPGTGFRSVFVVGGTRTVFLRSYETDSKSETFTHVAQPDGCYDIGFVSRPVGGTGEGVDKRLCCDSEDPVPYTINVEGNPTPELGHGGASCEWTFSLECPGDLCYEEASVDVSFTGDPPLDSFMLGPAQTKTVEIRPQRAYQVDYTNENNVISDNAQTQIYCERPEPPEGEGKP